MNAPQLIPYQPEGPQPLVRETTDIAYPVEALGPLREAAEAAQHAAQSPMPLAGQSALSVASLAVQGFADVQTLGGVSPASLFCLTIAASGERKSASDRLLMRGLRELEREAHREYEDALSGHEIAREVWKAERDTAFNGLKGKDKTGARADLEALGAEPAPPLKPFLTTTEPTLQGLHRLFAEGQPCLGLFSDEGGGFFGGHAMNKENGLTTMAGLSDLWGGEPIKRTRAGDGASALYGRRLAVHLMAQPEVAAKVLDDPFAIGQGFLPRFLITKPASAIGFREVGTIPDEAVLSRFANTLKAHLEAPKPLAEGTTQELEPRTLTLPVHAMELLLEFAKAVEAAQRPGGELEGVKAFASKAPEQACRIAGVLTLWSNRDAAQVTPEAMVHGIDLANYYLGQARELVENATVSRETAKAETLRKWLLQKWPEIAVTIEREPSTILKTDIIQRGPTSLREARKITPLLAMLQEAGWLVRLDTGAVIAGTARKEAWQIVRA